MIYTAEVESVYSGGGMMWVQCTLVLVGRTGDYRFRSLPLRVFVDLQKRDCVLDVCVLFSGV